MAEKITQRKEYRGLGYAPAISAPGLPSDYGIGATRPPAANELTRLAKSLKEAGAEFKNYKLRQAAVADEDAKRLAEETLASRALSQRWFPSIPSKNLTQGLSPKELNLIHSKKSVRAGMLKFLAQKTKSDAEKSLKSLLENKNVKPEVAEVLKKVYANNTAYFDDASNTTDLRKIAFSGTDEELLKAFTADTETTEKGMATLEGLIPKQATPAFYAYLRRGLAKSIAKDFAAQLTERIDEAADPFAADTEGVTGRIEGEVSKKIEEQAGEGWYLYAPDAVNEAAQEFRDAVAARKNEKRQEAADENLVREFSGIFETAGDAEELSNKLGNPLREAEASGQEIKKLAGKAATTSVAKLIARGHVSQARSLIDKLLDVKLNRGKATIPLLNEADEAQLEQMIERAEYKSKLNRPRRRALIEDNINALIEDKFIEAKGDLTSKEIRALAKEIHEKKIDLLEKDGEGNPLLMSPQDFAPDLYTENVIVSKILAHKQLSPGIKQLHEIIGKEIGDLIDSGDTESLVEARKRIEEERGSLSLSGYTRLKGLLKDAEAGAELLGSIEYRKEEAAGEDEVESRIDTGNLDEQGQAEAKANNQSEFRKKFKQKASETYREFLKNNPNATEDQRGAARAEAATEARKEVIEEMHAPGAVKARTESLKAVEDARITEALTKGAPMWGIFGPGNSLDDLERRSGVNQNLGRTLARSLKEGETFTEHVTSLKTTNPALHRIRTEQLKKIRHEQASIETAAWAKREELIKILNEKRIVGWFGATPLTEEKQQETVESLRRTLIHIGVSPSEVINKKLILWTYKDGVPHLPLLGRGIDLTEKQYGDTTKALFNHHTTPLFLSSKQLLELTEKGSKGEDDTIERMMKSLGFEYPESASAQKEFLQTQLNLLRSRGK